MQKNPLALFSGIATAGVLALGTAYYYMGSAPQPAPSSTAEQPAAAAPAGDTAAAPAAEAPAAPQQQPAAQAAAEPQTQAEPAAAAPAPAAGEQVAVAQPAPAPAPAAEAAAPEQPAAPAAQAPAKDQERLPAFDTVRVEPTGEAVIAGRAEPGASVAVKLNGQVVAEGTAAADGSFALIPEKPLEQGTGALTLSMTKNGATVDGEGSVVVAVKENAPALVAKVDPVEPTEVVQMPPAEDGPLPKDVQLNAVDYDSAGNIVFTGRAKPGSTVRFYVDNTLAGETQADSSGRWIFKGGPQVAPGEHVLRADQVDAAGKVLSRIELPFLRETEEAVAASQQPAQTPAPAPSPAPQPAAEEQVAAAAPAPAAPPPAAPAPEKLAVKLGAEEQVVPTRIIIQPGNNLWRLSRQIYGRGKLYTVIYQANKDQIRSPHRIYPGQILTAPALKADR